MFFLLLLLLPVAEIYVLIQVWHAYGFANTFFALLLSAVLGIGLSRSQGLYILRKLQDTAGRGEIPSKEVLHGILIFIGGVLFIIPGFITDAIGFLLVVPGPRHLIATYILYRMKKAVGFAGTGFRIFTSSTFGGFRSGGEGFRSPFETGPLRDVSPLELETPPQVIDVTAVSLPTEKKNPNGRASDDAE